MDRNAAITVARALIEEMGIQPGELFPEPEAPAPAPDIDALLPRRRWVPEEREAYCFLEHNGDVEGDVWDGGVNDRRRADIGNVFLSYRDAKNHIHNIRAWVELRERSNHPEHKVTGYFIKVTGEENWHLPGVRFSTPALRDAAVAHIGKDRIDNLIRWIWNL